MRTFSQVNVYYDIHNTYMAAGTCTINMFDPLFS